MGRLGTDLVAVVCILGGAAAGGLVTLLALDSGDAWEEEVAVACTVETEAPNVVVALGDGAVSSWSATVAVGASECAEQQYRHVYRLHMDDARRDMERARRDMERARRDVERERIRIERIDVDQEALLESIEAELAGQLELLELRELDLVGGVALEMEALEKAITGVRGEARTQARAGGGGD